MATYNKLVRDGIPDHIRRQAGVEATIKILTPEEMIPALIGKLREETDEFAASLTLEELADIQETINALAEIACNATVTELEAARVKKAVERGAFKERIWLIEVPEKS
jgi:predicted house-cleaning noncanonical NTP pyrophosphatase (MazG superfamily)